MIKIKYAKSPKKLQSELKELNKVHVVKKKTHETKQEILVDLTGEFEVVGNLSLGDQIRETQIRFRNVDVFASYVKAIDEGYETEDAIFNGYIHKINSPQFKVLKRCQCGNGCDFKHEIFEYRGNNCSISTKVFCFVGSLIFITGED